MSSDISNRLISATIDLKDRMNELSFDSPTEYVYNPLDYAWAAHEQYLRMATATPTKVVFLGMNPGPFGMVQTGVPFGEVAAVKDWIGIDAAIGKPPKEHPKRPVDGLACSRSEVSGRRLWGLFADRFGSSSAFFKDHFVGNFCPLAFMEEGGRNRTPDKLPASEGKPLLAACDHYLREALIILEPDWLVAVGGFAESRAVSALSGLDVRIGKVLHPSPASPAANRGWAEQATHQLENQGIW
jgi:single-strand selective monofunctional uracil DNA glycosylase